MTDLIASAILNAQGPVNAGSGDQTNHIYAVSLANPQGRTPRQQAADELRELARRFESPLGLANAREILKNHRTVFLHGTPGSGRSTAARMLLRELAPNEAIQQLILQDRENGMPFDLRHIGDGDRMWIDLSSVDVAIGGWQFSDIRDHLRSLRSAVQKHAAYLVAVIPDQTARLDQELDGFRASIQRPPLYRALLRHLRARDLLPRGFEPDLALKFADQERPLRDVSEYVSLIADAKAQAAGGGNFAEWCAAALAAFSGRESEVKELIPTIKDGAQRALLITVAMLHGASAEAIEQETVSLMAKADHPPACGSVLEREPLDARLSAIHAKRDTTTGRVRFLELGIDAAVRSFFWTQMFATRQPILDWVLLAIDSASLDQADRDNLIRNFVEDYLTDDRHAPLLARMVVQFTGARATANRVDAAAHILRHGLRAERCGRAFRKQIYQWSIDNNTSDQLGAVLVAACRDDIFATQPDEALVRLHHLARRKRLGAHETLIGLISADPRALRQMLGRISERDPKARQWEEDRRLFLDMADPWALIEPGEQGRPLIDELPVANLLRVGWALVFDGVLPNESWIPRARGWISCAAESERCRCILLDVLVRGATSNAQVLAELYAMAGDMEYHDAVGHLLLRKITRVFGVELP